MSAAKNHTLNFHGQELVLVDREGIPYVAMRPVVDGMGMAWEPQYRKLVSQKEKYSTVTIMVTVNGERREATCIALQNLPLWLATIHPNKIKDLSIKARVELYQKESAIALYEYWFHGGAINPRATASQLEQLEARIDRLQQHVELFGCKTRYGAISSVNGLPKVVNVHGYWRTDGRLRNVGQMTVFDLLQEKP